MSNNLENQAPADTFKSLLQTGNNDGVQGIITPIQDGKGDATALAISSNAARVNGAFAVTGNSDVSGDLTVAGGLLELSKPNDNASLYITSSNTLSSRIYFGDVDDSEIGRINYNHGFDFMDFYVNGAEKMRIDSNGKVGIGTEDPEVIHHISTVNDSANFAVSRYTADSQQFDVGVGGSAVSRTELQNKFYIFDSTNSIIRLVVDGGGNVGIGTAAPSAPLEVSSTTGGVILPRMNDTQMNAITNPTAGEMVFNTTDSKFYGYNGTSWVALH